MIYEQAIKRLGKRQFHAVRVVPNPHEMTADSITGLCWIGTYSMHDSRRMWIDRYSCFHDSGVWWSPGQMARDYLTVKNIRSSRITGEQLNIFNEKQPPMLAFPGRYSDMAYVDLKAAYWSIMRVMGWGVDYFPGLWLAKKDDVKDFPFPDYKLGRNALVGVGILTGEARVFWQGQYQTRKVGSRWANSNLWGLVQDVLHSVMWAAVDCGAVYVNVDGAIMPAKRAEEFQDFCAWNSLTAEVRAEGDAIITGVGRYQVGDKKTRTPASTPHYAHNLNPNIRDGWTLARFRKFSQLS